MNRPPAETTVWEDSASSDRMLVSRESRRGWDSEEDGG